jgi:hypothetical protein
MAYVDASVGKCLLCGHEEDEQSYDEQEESID